MSARPVHRALLDALSTLPVATESEQRELTRLREASHFPDAWGRSAPLHFTASAVVVHPPSARVLLRWHERQEAWMQVGGHADPGETDPLAIALREAEEETGLGDLRAWPEADRPELVQAVIVPVEANDTEPAHEHADLRYVLATDQPEAIRPENDRSPLRWLSVPEAIELTGEANVEECLHRVAELFA